MFAKPMGMRFRVPRSLKLISISSSMDVVAIAPMSALLPDAVVQLGLAVPSTGSLLPSATLSIGLTNLLIIILFLFTMSFLIRDVVQVVSGGPLHPGYLLAILG